MFALTENYNYYIYRHSTDMRKGFHSLCGLVEEEFHRLPGGEEVFLFLNKRRNSIKLLHWEKGGFVLYHKRLEEGTFNPILSAKGDRVCVITWIEMVMMIEGIEAIRMVQRKRYIR